MDFFILLSDTEDWYGFNDDVESYLKHSGDRFAQFMSLDSLALFNASVRRWTELVQPSYMTFRGKLRDISANNHFKVGLPVKHRTFNAEMGRDQIALISDDDDCFNPRIVEHVSKAFEQNPHAEVVHWDTWQYDTTWYKERFLMYRESRIGSNGLAVRGGNCPCLYTWGAHNKVHRLLPPEKVHYLPYKSLSLWNIHPASFWQRTNYPLHDDFYKLERSPRPAILDWAKDEIDAIYGVIKSLSAVSST